MSPLKLAAQKGAVEIGVAPAEMARSLEVVYMSLTKRLDHYISFEVL